MSTTTRTFWLSTGHERLPDGFFLFSNGKRRRARFQGDVAMVEQVPVVPDDPRIAAEAAHYNEVHRRLFGHGTT